MQTFYHAWASRTATACRSLGPLGVITDLPTKIKTKTNLQSVHPSLVIVKVRQMVLLGVIEMINCFVRPKWNIVTSHKIHHVPALGS